MKHTLKYIKRCNILPSYDLLISCSLFKMQYSYRDFSSYIRHMRTWLPKIPKTAYVRLYVDASVLQEPSFIELFDANYPKLEIVLYQFDDFLDDTGVYHDGTFGSITRLLALYNKPAVPKTVKYVWTSDLDMSPYVFTYNNILDLKYHKARISTFSWACYTVEWVDSSVRYPTLAGKIISETSIKYDFKDFETFLTDVIKGKYANVMNNILKRLEKESSAHRMQGIRFFPYGFDEKFLGEYLVKEFEKYRWLIYYNISLTNIKYKYDIPHLEQLKKLERKTWYAKATPEVRHKLLKLNEDVYEFMKTQEVDSPRIKMCLADFNTYKKNIDKKMAVGWALAVPFVSVPKNS